MRQFLRRPASFLSKPVAFGNTVPYSTERSDSLIKHLVSSSPVGLRTVFVELLYDRSSDLRELLSVVNSINDDQELLRALQNLKDLYYFHRSYPWNAGVSDQEFFPVLKSLIRHIQLKLLNARIESYFAQFRNLSTKDLKELIFESQKALEERVDHLDERAKLYAARRALHPEFQIIVAPSAEKLVLAKAKANCYETAAFVVKGNEKKLSGLVDHFIFVSNENDPYECVRALKVFMRATGIKNYRAAIDPGLSFNPRTKVLSAACERHNFSNRNAKITFLGSSSFLMTLFGNEWFTNNWALELGLDVVPGYYEEHQDMKSLLEEARNLGLDKAPLLLRSGVASQEVRSIEECQKFIEEIRSNNPRAKFIIQKVLEHDYIGAQVLCAPDGSFYFAQHHASRGLSGKVDVRKTEDPAIKEMSLTIANAAWFRGHRGFLTIEFLTAGDQKYFHKIVPSLSWEYGESELKIGDLELIDVAHWVGSGYLLKSFLEEFLKNTNQYIRGESTKEMLQRALRTGKPKTAYADFWKNSSSKLPVEVAETSEKITFERN